MRKDERIFYKKNKLQQLRGFCMTMEEGTIAKAAAKMLTAESNVSLQISSLEEELKLELFIREKKRLTPTEDAWKIYAAARHHVTGIDEVYTETAKIIKGNNDKTLRIAAHSYALSHLLPKSISKMINKNQNVSIKLYNILRDDAIRMLKNGSVDIVVFPMDQYDEDLIIDMLYKGSAVLGVHKKHPLAKIDDKDITWDEIKKHEIAHVGKGVVMQGLASNIKNYKLKTRVSVENGGTWDIGRGLIKCNIFAGIFDKGYLNEFDKKYIIEKSISHLTPDYSFQTVITKGKHKAILIEFMNILREHFTVSTTSAALLSLFYLFALRKFDYLPILQ